MVKLGLASRGCETAVVDAYRSTLGGRTRTTARPRWIEGWFSGANGSGRPRSCGCCDVDRKGEETSSSETDLGRIGSA